MYNYFGHTHFHLQRRLRSTLFEIPAFYADGALNSKELLFKLSHNSTKLLNTNSLRSNEHGIIVIVFKPKYRTENLTQTMYKCSD